MTDRKIGVFQRRNPDPDCEIQSFFDHVHTTVGRIE